MTSSLNLADVESIHRGCRHAIDRQGIGEGSILASLPSRGDCKTWKINWA